MLSVEDAKHNIISTKQQSIEVEQITIQKKRSEKMFVEETDRYSLILFDFDKADIQGSNQKIIEFIKSRI